MRNHYFICIHCIVYYIYLYIYKYLGNCIELSAETVLVQFIYIEFQLNENIFCSFISDHLYLCLCHFSLSLSVSQIYESAYFVNLIFFKEIIFFSHSPLSIFLFFLYASVCDNIISNGVSLRCATKYFCVVVVFF